METTRNIFFARVTSNRTQTKTNLVTSHTMRAFGGHLCDVCVLYLYDDDVFSEYVE